MVIEPFQIDVPAATLERIRRRLGDAVWPDVPAGDPWAHGTSEPALRELVAHWLERYDWRAREAAINRWPQFKAHIDGYEIHFIHVRGAGDNPRPLLLAHGWPGAGTPRTSCRKPMRNAPRWRGSGRCGRPRAATWRSSPPSR